jgi:ring-1,2-phenylacetyl-CoA epoxidase subunit PaaC
MLKALNELWSYTGEMFDAAGYEKEAGVDVGALKESWNKKVTDILNQSTLPYPVNVFMHTGGKNGYHTEQLGYILTELQYMQRTYPNASW